MAPTRTFPKPPKATARSGSVRRVNQRRERSVRSPIVLGSIAVVVLLIAAAVYWFAIRDDNDGGTTAKPGGSGTSSAQTFQVTGVPFTFQYPGTFAQAAAQSGFVWIAGISPVDILDLKRVDKRAYSVQGLTTVFGSRLSTQPGVKVVGSGKDEMGGLKTVTYTVDSGTSPRLRSKLVYFSTAGATWQLECQSQAQNRAAIDVGCAQALATFTTR